MTYISILVSALLTITGTLGLFALSGRAVLSTIKEKRPEMDCFDRSVYTVFLGLFVIAAFLLIKCVAADPVIALF